MTRTGALPAVIYLQALQAGMTPEQAHAAAYPTPALFSDNKGAK
ncbi:hypothetical protein J2X12_002876 [Pseudarthrobacter oxydans]|uniref:Transposase n=1 Tax=Pseudarthrobacter oxydans TaxID=1671 RepID=A0AAW8NFY4_PSEOX|nr:hypothetical protein [Pseudarthrobacter oxydans]MDR6794387.1 hypothetical protein [Pseudarthrobacter oxydans]MDR7164838.1 hypothetical protein [Pseudarthrobacter oxydans]